MVLIGIEYSAQPIKWMNNPLSQNRSIKNLSVKIPIA